MLPGLIGIYHDPGAPAEGAPHYWPARPAATLVEVHHEGIEANFMVRPGEVLCTTADDCRAVIR